MEQNTNSDKALFFTDKEFATIIKETERGFDPKSVTDIDKKTITDKQLNELFNSELQTSHILLVCKHMNVENPVEKYKAHVMEKEAGTEPIKGQQQSNAKIAQQAEKLGRNAQNAIKGMNID